MKKFLNNIKAEASHIRMSTAEKAAMRALLRERFEGHSAPVKSPYSFAALRSFSGVGSNHFRMVIAGLLVFVLTGAGTASAAQGALPGDLLYTVKINVTEPVKVALASTPAAKAAVHAELADVRVEEAQALAAQGRLDATTTAALATNFDHHAQNAQEFADAAEEEDPAAATQVKTKLASSLAANGAVLREIGKGSKDEDTKRESDLLSTRVIARAEGPVRVAMSARTFAAMAPSAKSAPAPQETSADASVQTMMFTASGSAEAEMTVETGNQKTAARLQKKAAEALAETKELFAEAQESLDATTSAQIGQEVAVADTHMSVGSEALGAGHYAQAQEEFTSVLRISARVSALMTAQKRFDGGIIKMLINDSFENESSDRDSENEDSWDDEQKNEPAIEVLPPLPVEIDLGR